MRKWVLAQSLLYPGLAHVEHEYVKKTGFPVEADLIEGPAGDMVLSVCVPRGRAAAPSTILSGTEIEDGSYKRLFGDRVKAAIEKAGAELRRGGA